MDRRLGVAIVGCNGIAYAHAHGIRLCLHTQLLAACDLNEDAVHRFVEAHPEAEPVTDYHHLLVRDDIDLVVVATSDESHAEIAIAVAEAGKHVLVEKPMATSLADADAVVAAVDRNGVKAMCGQSIRFLPKLIAAKQIVDDGRIGRPVYARMVCPSSPLWTEEQWRRFKSERGPQWLLIHNGMHNFDYLSWLFNSLPVRVYGVTHPGQSADSDWLDVHEFVSVNIRFQNGAIAVNEENRIMQPQGYPFHFELYVVGTRGTFDLSDRVTHPLSIWSRNGIDFPGAQSNYTDLDHPFALQIGNLAQSILEDTPPLIPLSFSLDVLRALFGAVESCRTARVVKPQYRGVAS